MSCFGCFGGAKDDRAAVTRSTRQQSSAAVPLNQQPSAPHTASELKSVTAAPQEIPVSSSSPTVPAPQPAPPGPPWRSREELANIALRVADASGPWLERALASTTVLADSLGASLTSIWAFSTDKSTAVVLSSGGILCKVQPQGFSVAVGPAAEGEADTSLRAVVAREAPFAWSSEANGNDGQRPVPPDCQQLATWTGMQHFVMLPLKYGGALAGALQICLGGLPPPTGAPIRDSPPSFLPYSSDSPPQPGAVAPPGVGLLPPLVVGPPGEALKSVPLVPNWLPHHLPDLMLLCSSAAVGGAAFAMTSHVPSGPGGAAAKPLPQAVVDMVATLRRCDTISKLIAAVIGGLQDLTFRITSMQFCATPMLVHRTGITAAIFQEVSGGLRDPAAGGGASGNTRSEQERGIVGGSAAGVTSGIGGGAGGGGNNASLPEGLDAMSRGSNLRAHVTHLNHTLMLQLITGAYNGRYRRQYGGSIIQNCSEYMQDESNRGRDVSLCHRVGMADVGSMVLATGIAAGGVPLLCAYLTSKEPLPEPLLESVLAVLHEALKLSMWTINSLLSCGELVDEWATLHDLHLNPTSVAVSTSCTPRSMLRSATKDLPPPPLSALTPMGGGQAASTLGHTASLPSGMPHSGLQDDGLLANLGNTTRRNLSFGIAPHSAAAPRSNLGMMVSSIRSSLNQVLSQRAALEAEGLQDDVNGVELLKQIGQGGQGVVFCGTLHGLEVAIKVVGTEEGADEVYDIDDEGQMIKLKRVLKRDATELAVTTSISHPNIVQVFSYFVDVMVVEYVGQPDRFKLLPKVKGNSVHGADNGGVTGPSNMIICMEYCDAGSLKQAVKRGCFRTEVPRPNMQALYTTLMEIALALRHLHALRLVHCDLKPSNILLKSSMRDPRGWVCKLSDFGCVRLMSEPAAGQRPSFNLEYAVGTPSFMAPEMFCKGHPLDAAVDIYSFGILMWEVYTGGTVYDGVQPDKLPYHVVKRGLRPAFPPDTPSAFRSLAQACWASDPRSRPTAAALVTVLQRLLSSCATSQGGPAAPATASLSAPTPGPRRAGQAPKAMPPTPSAAS